MKEMRREKCSLRAAFRNWILFCAALAVAAIVVHAWNWMVALYITKNSQNIVFPQPWWINWYNDNGFLDLMNLFLLGPEYAASDIMARCVSKFGGVYPEFYSMMPVFLMARFCLIFAWGVFRLQRGKRAPYAETLWLLAVSAFVVIWLDYDSYIPIPIGYCMTVALTVLTGIVVFAVQRRRPPAWKWKMPE